MNPPGNDGQNTGNTGHTGHSDFNFQLRRQSHNANNDNNSLLHQSRNNGAHLGTIYNSNRVLNLNPHQGNLNLNHSHNSLMFQNHLRGLGMQQHLFQAPAHLRS